MASARNSEPADPQARELDALLELIHRERGLDFSGYKRSTLTRRIHQRAAAVGAASLLEYRERIRVSPRKWGSSSMRS